MENMENEVANADVCSLCQEPLADGETVVQIVEDRHSNYDKEIVLHTYHKACCDNRETVTHDCPHCGCLFHLSFLRRGEDYQNPAVRVGEANLAQQREFEDLQKEKEKSERRERRSRGSGVQADSSRSGDGTSTERLEGPRHSLCPGRRPPCRMARPLRAACGGPRQARGARRPEAG